MKNVLLVDDSKSARMVLKKMLEKHSMGVELAESGEEAIVYLQSARPDIIFMDHLMPGMDGLEVAKIISTDPKTKNIPIVMCTSKEGEEYLAEARAHGAVEILCKPPTNDQVKKIILNLNELREKAGTESLQKTSQLVEEAELPEMEEINEGMDEDIFSENDVPVQALEREAPPPPAPSAGVDKALVVSTVDSILETRWEELNNSLNQIVDGLVESRIESELEKALTGWQDATLVEATIHTEQAVKQQIEKDLDRLQNQIRSLAEIIDQFHDEKEGGVESEELKEWQNETHEELNALAKRVNRLAIFEEDFDEIIDKRIKENNQESLVNDELKHEINKLTDEAITAKKEELVSELEEVLTERMLSSMKSSLEAQMENLVRNIASVTATGAAKEALNEAMDKFEASGKFVLNSKAKASGKKRWALVGVLISLALAAGVSYYFFDLIPML